MKQATSGVGVASGLSSQSSFAGTSEKSMGMATKGKDQKPVSIPKSGAKKGGKSFVIG